MNHFSIVKNLKLDIAKLYMLFSLAVLITYKAPHIVNLVFQIILLILFWRSKRDYFWLALVFVVEANPGGLFYALDSTHSFSLINNSPFGNLYFWIIFTGLAFFKAVYQKRKPGFFLKKEIAMLAFYFISLVLVFGVYRIPPVVRMLLPWLYLYILPRLMHSWEDYVSFFNLIFAFVPIVLLMQFYSLFFGGTMATLLGGISNPALHYKTIAEAGQALRPVDGIFIPWLALLGTTLFLSYRANFFSKNYLNLILALSIFSIFITATRSWLIASLFVFVGYNVVNSVNPIKLASRYLLPALLLVLLVVNIPFLKKQSEMALQRYETVQLLMKGDITAGGTLQRFDVRGPRVIKHFYESPIIGWGYGKQGAEYADGHVGHQNLLMQTGIIGYVLFWLLWLSFINKMLKSYRHFDSSNPLKKVPLILVIFFIGIHVINISAQWFNYILGFGPGFILCLLLSLSNFVYQKSYLKYNNNEIIQIKQYQMIRSTN